MARIFLTGSRGYLGQSVRPYLEQAGHEIADLTGRLSELPPASIATDVVIHLAAALRDRDRAEIIDTNGNGTRALLRALTPNARVIFLSSRAVYGPTRPAALASERTPVAPPDDYGMSKLAAERLVMESGQPFVILRPSTLFGAGPMLMGRNFVNQFVDRACRGEALMISGGSQLVDPAFVDDVARVVATLVDDGPWWSAIYNIAGTSARVLDLARLVVDVVARLDGPRARIDVNPGAEPPGVLLDCTKLDGCLSHRRVTPPQEVIEQLIARRRSTPATP